MPTYSPKPLSTEGVNLPPELLALVETLAANNHDQWAQQRMQAGWTYGVLRDDSRKTHPDLVPFDELPEGEKEYDRVSVVETIKAVLALGYEIRATAKQKDSND